MLNKLAFRNARRSMRDYLIYLVTMTIISALMLAFNSLIFSRDLKALYAQDGGIMAAMLCLVTFFLIFIIAWLFHYMIRFMLEKRSREFGTYLLMGMKRKEIRKLFTRENLLIGAAALILGILPGLFFQQILTAIFYHIFQRAYHLSAEVSGYGLLMTVCLFGAVYFLALWRNRRAFKKMKIYDLLYLDRQNQMLRRKQTKRSAVWLFLAVAYTILFFSFLFTGSFNMANVWPMSAGLIVCVYLFYAGLSGLTAIRIERQGKGIYKGERIFLLRQMASKIKTMRFTMGSITVLLALALVGCSAAMMLSDYQNKMLETELPFDVIMFSDEKDDDFARQIAILEKEAEPEALRVYRVYENGSTTVNDWLRENLPYFQNKSQQTENTGSSEYFDYDTYMKLSDYNALRQMLGEEPIRLGERQYLIQTKERLKDSFQRFRKETGIEAAGHSLSCAGIETIPFAQSGENGADYILVVPDRLANSMNPFYSLLAADLKGSAPDGLQDLLADSKDYENEETGEMEAAITWGYGTNEIITMAATVMVRDNMMGEMRFVLASMAYPLFYIAIVFLCVSMTILSVQQLSDSAKYRFRYQVLSKLGLREREIGRIVLKQLASYYLWPMLMAVILSGILSIYAGQRFVFYTGIPTSALFYYGISLLIFAGVYLLYFAATYTGFKRNLF